jgi:hypothetical protein
MSQELAVVTAHFNWAGFARPVENLKRFVAEMETASVPLYGMELSLTDRFEMDGNPNWIKLMVGPENVCFQKEACINLVERIVPSQYTKIAWVDHDIQFKRTDWYDAASDALDKYKFIQLFSEEVFTDKDGKEVSSTPSLLKAGGPQTEDAGKHCIGTPGAANGARRELWKHGGLYPYCFMGGGDSVILYSMYGLLSAAGKKSCGADKNFEPYQAWKETARKYVEEACSFVDGQAVHSWHGERDDRQYVERHTIADKINWNASVRLNARGILEINPTTDDVRKDITNYFINRWEDGRLNKH